MVCSCQTLTEYIRKIALCCGMSENEAFHFAESLVSADMRGLSSHGVMRTAAYIRRVQDGLIATHVSPEITADGTTVLAVNGKNGMGCTVAVDVMDLCMERAETYGSCLAAVNHCNHFGYAAYFAMRAAKRGFIAVVMTNAAAMVAPFGGAAAMLGTNPLCVAIPAGRHEPFVLDMATSLVAQGKVILAGKEGRRVPLGWGLDREGRETEQPEKILNGGTLLPFGGAKGYGISLMIELLTACLANASRSTDMGRMYDYTRRQETGFVMGALKVGGIMPLACFTDRVDEIISEIKGSKKAPGAEEIFIPGEIEDRKYKRALREGIVLSQAVAEELKELGQSCGVSFPWDV